MKVTYRSLWALGCFQLILLFATTTSRGESGWPQWRGPARNGQATGAPWPSSLATNHLVERWHAALGPSYSGPVFSNGRLFTTETLNKKQEVVTCFDLATGAQLWRREWEGAVSVPFFAKSNGDWIRSTPAIDEDRLYVGGMRDVLLCLEVATGKVLWKYDFVTELKSPLPEFGMICSPLVEKDAVYTQAGAAITCLDKKTGKLRWRSLQDAGGMWGNAFSSPIVGEIGGKRQLIVQTREKLAGLDLDDGAVLWTQAVTAFRGMNILTPVLHRSQLLTSSYGGKTTLFKISKESTGWGSAETWSLKTQGYMSTPVIVGEVAYHHAKNERLMALDLTSGAELWTTPESFGKYMSLVAHGDRILGLDQRGWLHLFRANPAKFDLIEKRRLTESETWAHIAVADGFLAVRALNSILVYRWE